MVLDLFAERIRQPSEPSHVHSHVEILAFHIAGADVLMVRGPDDIHTFGAQKIGRAHV